MAVHGQLLQLVFRWIAAPRDGGEASREVAQSYSVSHNTISKLTAKNAHTVRSRYAGTALSTLGPPPAAATRRHLAS